MSDREAARAKADHAEGLGDPGAEAQGSHGRVQEDHPAGQEALAHGLNGFADQVTEHLVSVLAAVIAPRPLVQVALEPLVRDGVVSAAHPGLEQAEEAFDGLGVNVALT